jgi:ADP-heptose:LPS heptosyltransferase
MTEQDRGIARLSRRTRRGVEDAALAARLAFNLDRRDSIAIRVTGGMGDHIVAVRFIRDLLNQLGDAKIDVYSVTGGVSWLYESLSRVRVIEAPQRVFTWVATRYLLALQVTHTVDVLYVHPGAAERWPRLAEMLHTIAPYRKMLWHSVDMHPSLDFHPALVAQFQGTRRDTFLNHVSGIPFGGHSFSLPRDSSLLQSERLDRRPYITVHHSFNERSGRPRTTRDYPFMDQVMKEVKSQFPEVSIVQVGVVGGTLGAVDLNLSCRTTQPQITSVIAGSLMHFDIEGGLVHIASCVDTTCCVVFGPTPIGYYGYPQNINIAPVFCGNCWSITQDWMETCLRGFEEPPCMFTHSPMAVAHAALPRLRALLDEKSHVVS